MTELTLRMFVEWVDTDAAGHHHHASVARFVEAAEQALYRSLGEPQLMKYVPRVAYRAEYLSRLFYQDEIVVRLRVAKLGTTSLTYEFDIHRVGDGTLAARGSYTVVHIGELQGRSAPWPDDLRARLGGG
jgi:acyl-CoA thioester hydrolase